MVKRIVWKEGDLVSLKLRENLYALAQMTRNSIMRFYAASSATGDWSGLTLDTTPVLFSGFVGKIVLRQLAVEQIPAGSPLIVGDHERYWLRPLVKFEGGFPFRDADLSDRLCRYFDTGVNRDDLKFEVFPGLWTDRQSMRPLTRRLPVPLR